MGHTLVAAFDSIFIAKMNESLANTNANKIPFGRQCDREEANRRMNYHMTIAHWAKEKDGVYLPRLDQIHISPFRVTVTASSIMYDREDSALLYFAIEPGNGCRETVKCIRASLEIEASDFLHITIAASQNFNFILELKKKIDTQFRYPFELDINGLDVYHIWEPVVLMKHIEAHIE